MKNLRIWLAAVAGVLLSIVPSTGLAQVKFFGVGDLPGGIVQSDVRDATRVGNVLYAVGGSSANAGSTGDDTAFLWTSTGGMTALPPLTAGVVATNVVVGSAITPDAQYIASRAHFNPVAPGQRHAVRVTTAGLVNLDLGTLPGFPQNSVATSISSDGSVLYGWARYDAAGDLQAVRFTAAGPTVTAIPFLNAGDVTSSPAARGASSDGTVMVGTSASATAGPYGPGNAAFRYVQGAGVSAIPFLPGGTWNIAVALTPDGNLAVVFGDSPNAPNGEIYLYNAATTGITSLGTPAAGWQSANLVGVNVDATLVAANFANSDGTVGASFVRNASGWHEFHAIVAGTGVDLTGWTLDNVEGMSSDGTRVWGSGQHNGNQEGFIVEFPARYLAAYAASLPAQSIVGAYTDTDNTTEPASVIIFLANGTYYQIQDAPAADAPAAVDGFERGTYTWDPVTHAFTVTTLLDTNGDSGLCPGVCGVAGITATRLGNFATLQLAGVGASSAALVTGASPIVGAWVIGDTTIPDSSAIITFFANGTYLMAQDGPSGDPTGHDGMERGTYTWNPGTGAFTATTLVDTNGSWGLSNPQGSQTVTVSGDTLTIDDGTGPVMFSRVIAPPLAPSVTVMMTERTHVAAGIFDHVLGTDPTSPITEPRIGPNHNLIFTFDKPVTGGTATVTEGIATVGTPVFSGYQMLVPLAGVADQKYVTVSLTNVTSADGGTGGTGSGRVGFLAGDVNGSRRLAVTDLVVVNAQLGKALTTANFLSDVNASGVITVLDKVIVNNNLGHLLPAP